MDPNLRNLKDFLTLYNKVTELCFSRCVETLYERELTNAENTCIDKCVTKFARFNQKMMNVYVEVQTDINQKRIQELETTQKQVDQASTSSSKVVAAGINSVPMPASGAQTPAYS
ncbi:mitochondrial import inner membrane translocase subunit Tim10B [Bactrocera oleae]|uniref:mitochondrial import inner membrane translocase subunit Tim10B n=1 Tax=Bactrocera oleae TaxID=104688 RepID=UPI0006B7346A|nr:mitochondrial import inner membrane translocase subunit Tim10B-like [Bactrocera oleae]XP_036233171.1 mitochondrial import inner membrane translocase subunit Tim10B-like [Bactrocera oleae]